MDAKKLLRFLLGLLAAFAIVVSVAIIVNEFTRDFDSPVQDIEPSEQEEVEDVLLSDYYENYKPVELELDEDVVITSSESANLGCILDGKEVPEVLITTDTVCSRDRPAN